MTTDTQILYCECAFAGVVPAAVKQQAGQILNESGLGYHAVPDLCKLAAHKAPALAELAGASRLLIAACHPRAVRWLFAAGGAPLRDEGVEYVDLREGAIEQLRSSLRDIAAVCAPGSRREIAAKSPDGTAAWKSWFPVIDRSRCQDCGQCLGFCLFGVYGTGADGTVEVQNPASCKTGCPACARVCPDAAIIFPKYANAPINGGDAREGAQAEPVKLDKADLLKGDVLKALQERGRNGARFTAGPDQARAMRERLAHLGLTSTTPSKSEPT